MHQSDYNTFTDDFQDTFKDVSWLITEKRVIQMPIHYLIDNNYRCVIKIWTGEITLEDWRESERQVLATPDLPRNFKMLIDARKAEKIKLSHEDIQEIVEFYRVYQDTIKGAQVAMLAGAFFDQARIYEKYVQPLGVNVIVFANFDTACTWLNLDRALVNEHIGQLQRE